MRDLDRVGTLRGETSCYYAACGRNKRSLCIDIKAEGGRDVLLRLIDRADVLIHNFRPGVMERLGLDYETLRERNLRLIYAAAFAFGETGPMSKMPGQDMLAQSFSGFIRHGADENERPQLTSPPGIDYAAGVSLAQGILVALLERERSGLGQKVVTSLFSVALAMQMLEVSSLSMHRYRTRWPQQSMIFRTKDGWITVLTLFRDNPLQLLCQAFGVDDMSQDPALATTDLQIENLQKIYDSFGPVVERYSTAECLEKLSQTDILCSPINDLSEVIDHPQTLENGMIWDVPVPGSEPARLVGNPVRLSRTPAQVYRGVTDIGAESEQVLSSFGFPDDEIAALKSSGVIL